MSETGVTVTSTTPCIRINFVKVTQNGLNRSVQAIEIQAIEPCLLLSQPYSIVVLSKPTNKIEHVGISPHPCWKALEIAQGIHRFHIISVATDEAVNSVGIGPVGLNGDG